MNSSRLLLLSACVALSSCSIHRPLFEVRKAETKPAETTAKAEPTLFEWAEPGIQGKPSVVIDLGEQKARILDDGKPVAWTYVATGTAGHRTPTGTFYISEKKSDKVSNTWGIIVDADGDTVNWNGHSGRSSVPSGGRFVGAPMPNWMRLTDYGVGMHGGIIPDPGYPASHGCIRLPYPMAETMFAHLPTGTKVTITE